MNQQPFGLPPQWWPPRMSPWWVRRTRGYRRWQLRGQRIVSLHVSGEEHLRQALRQGGVLITPNHSTHYDSNSLYAACDRLDVPLFFMTAWQVFAMSNRWQRFLMQRVGCFSVDRESNDRKAMGEAVRILREEPWPLVIFPEGDIYHTNDLVTSFREGAAAIAMLAARKSPRPVAILPCAIKFTYESDPQEELSAAVAEMEQRLYLRTDAEQGLVPRIHRLAEASLALKELDVLGETRSGRIRDRIQFLLQALLEQLETSLLPSPREAGREIPPARVKRLRQELIRRGTEASLTPAQRQQLRNQMDDLFLAIQLYSYPGDYLVDSPSLERIAETVDKLEEDVLLRENPRVRGTRRVAIRFGPPLMAPAGGDRRRDEPWELTRELQHRVQSLLDGLAAQAGV